MLERIHWKGLLANFEREGCYSESNTPDVNDEKTVAFVEAAQREALMKVGYLTEEADKSSRKVVRVTEQLDLAQAVSHTLEIC
ncbi:interactor of constitutive active ROPs 2, chloroplastic [Tanacetum coccineum]